MTLPTSYDEYVSEAEVNYIILWSWIVLGPVVMFLDSIVVVQSIMQMKAWKAEVIQEF